MQFNFKSSMVVSMPKVEASTSTTRARSSAKSTFTKGAKSGGTLVKESLRDALNNAISSEWDWIQGTRDIIDTSELRNSLTLELKPTATGFSVFGEYHTRYSMYVHYGSIIKPYGNPRAADVVLPARPWVSAVFLGTHGQPKFDVDEPLSRGIKQAWAAQFGR